MSKMPEYFTIRASFVILDKTSRVALANARASFIVG
jgi:hypothetical protein